MFILHELLRLDKGFSHSVKYNRVRDFLKFIYTGSVLGSAPIAGYKTSGNFLGAANSCAVSETLIKANRGSNGEAEDKASR